ncbi:MAG: hypothetical protein ACLSVD_13140 [Eggerthellaceae bacterium]
MKHPDVTVGVEVVQNARTCMRSLPGIGGLPAQLGKVVCLLSSGITAGTRGSRRARRRVHRRIFRRPQTSDARVPGRRHPPSSARG